MFVFNYETEYFLGYLAEEPIAFIELFKHTLHMVVTTFLQRCKANVSICLEQIHVLRECHNLSISGEYELFAEANILRKGLANFTGVLTGYSDTLKSM